MKIAIKSFWPAIAWLVASTIAFCLPGSALPKNSWFDKVYFDKWVHIGIMSVMVVLWCLPLLHKHVQRPLTKLFVQIPIVILGYGILIEFIQHFFVTNRSFDVSDIGADAVGCLLGYLYMRSQWKA